MQINALPTPRKTPSSAISRPAPLHLAGSAIPERRSVVGGQINGNGFARKDLEHNLDDKATDAGALVAVSGIMKRDGLCEGKGGWIM